jgi:hypothetical protein
MIKQIFLLLVLLFTFPIALAAEHTTRPSIQMIVLDPSLEQYRVMWEHEVARRFPDAIVIMAHGGDLTGEWIIKSPNNDHILQKMSDLVKHYQTEYPNRQLVIVSCNPSHLRLGIKGVYYAPDSVWCCPDRVVMSHQDAQYFTLNGEKVAETGDRSEAEPDFVGSVFEFICE